METFVASRLTKGNRLFPAKIIIGDLGITLHIPGAFSDNERTIPFDRISSVNIICPALGYSTITIETTGESQLSARGFTQGEVKRMKEVILGKI